MINRYITLRRCGMTAVCVLALSLAGCGGGSENKDEEQVLTAVEQYNAAIADSDGARACELLTAESRAVIINEMDQIEGEDVVGEDCGTRFAQAIDALGLAEWMESDEAKGREFEVSRIENGEAEVTITNPGGENGVVALALEDGKWRVDMFAEPASDATR